MGQESDGKARRVYVRCRCLNASQEFNKCVEGCSDFCSPFAWYLGLCAFFLLLCSLGVSDLETSRIGTYFFEHHLLGFLFLSQPFLHISISLVLYYFHEFFLPGILCHMNSQPLVYFYYSLKNFIILLYSKVCFMISRLLKFSFKYPGKNRQ